MFVLEDSTRMPAYFPAYCPTALLPYCPTALLPYCPTALTPHQSPPAAPPYASLPRRRPHARWRGSG
ncbi:hypothetical protein EN935_11960 [Mesorhizobium sp. M7D.F.Ca.US.004.03.1.1]|nr:hypothetical protein EN993_24105 [Mesorhizobium sp. M7D.F.Ca.US.004.01.2.1]RVA32492.1 hypothetical protein EN935_11960 [Mesorhizobium sp. M7D.F.Ca.US.004.03.1.1]